MRKPDVFELLLSERIFRRLELRSARTSVFGDSNEKIAYFQGAALGTVCSRAVGEVPLYGRKMDHAVIRLRLDWTANDQVNLETLWKTLQACYLLLKDQDDFLIWFEEDCDQRPLFRHSSATIGLGQCLVWIQDLAEGSLYGNVDAALLYDCPPRESSSVPPPDVPLEEIRAASVLRNLLVGLSLGKVQAIDVQEAMDRTKDVLSDRTAIERIEQAERLWKDALRRSTGEGLSREQAQECTADLRLFLLDRWPMIMEPTFPEADDAASAT